MTIKLLSRIKFKCLKLKYNKIQFGNDIVILGKNPYFKMFPQSKCYIGDKVVFNSDVENSNTTLTTRCKYVLGHTGELTIGSYTMMNGVSITTYKSVKIGQGCQIASSTFITDTDFHPIDPTERWKQVTRLPYDFDSVNKQSVIIGDNVWIGWGSIILKGAKIGNNSIVAAGSIVLSEFPDNVIIAGNPAKIVKRLDNNTYM